MLSWGTSLVAQLVKNPPTMQETPVLYWVGKIHRRKNRLPTSVFLGFPGGSAGKEYTCKAGDLGLIPGLGRSLEEGKGYSLQYFGLENSMDSIDHWGHKELDMTEWLSLTLSPSNSAFSLSLLPSLSLSLSSSSSSSSVLSTVLKTKVRKCSSLKIQEAAT